jgi:tetraacyldisaccharide 4'-kinase
MLRELARERLERGQDSFAARALARVWERFADVERPLVIPRGVEVIGVGGATLGGSGKTPTVLAIARELAASRPVSVVASAYRSKVREARRVRVEDRPELVGDEAAYLARALEPVGVPVFVGESRTNALHLAGKHSRLVIVDGLLQARPERVRLSLLVLDARCPWGSGRCPPAGDLRATIPELVSATDAVVLVGEGELADLGRPVLRARSEIVGLIGPDGAQPLSMLEGARVGVALAIAHPERVLANLASLGVRPEEIVLSADHSNFDAARLAAGLGSSRLDAWLVSGKCGVKLEGCGVPFWVLDHRLQLEKGAVPGALEPW